MTTSHKYPAARSSNAARSLSSRPAAHGANAKGRRVTRHASKSVRLTRLTSWEEERGRDDAGVRPEEDHQLQSRAAGNGSA